LGLERSSLTHNGTLFLPKLYSSPTIRNILLEIARLGKQLRQFLERLLVMCRKTIELRTVNVDNRYDLFEHLSAREACSCQLCRTLYTF
jgi:hypothetical protein